MVKSIAVRPLSTEKGRNSRLSSAKGSQGSLGRQPLLREGSEFFNELASKNSWDKLKSYISDDPLRVGVVDLGGKSALHHAAEKGQTDILEFALSKGAAIDLQDDEGDTALHLAIASDQKAAVKFLMDHNADTEIKNKKMAAPIHVAVGDDKADIVELMCKYKQTNPDLPTACGASPLHVSAWKNSSKTAKVLLNAGANMNASCHTKGITPFHAGAMQGASETMEVILNYAQKTLMSLHTLLRPDNEKCTPLHSAVSNGSVEAIRICLKAGGDITSQQDDQATPVHLACTKGSVEMVKVLLEESGRKSGFFMKNHLELRDGMDMTPLHHAAMFDHVELCQYLIEKGADINVQDCDLRTPLFLAAHKMATNVMCVLLSRGADITIKDKQKRNFIHAAVISNCRLDALEEKMDKFEDLLNEKDDSGLTPLHYASQMGFLKSMDTLINTGAYLNPKSNSKESPLHFAARYGRLNSCRKLLRSKIGAQSINETDGMYQSALHMAAENGHEKVVELLMKKGAVIQKDTNGLTPLHLAGKNGYTRTIKAILAIHEHALNLQDMHGNTAIHFASEGGHPSAVTMFLDEGAAILDNDENKSYLDIALISKQTDVALVTVRHDRWEEIFGMGSRIYMCYAMGFIEELPEICPIVYDRMISVSYDENGNKMTTYNFRLIQENMQSMMERRKRGEKINPLPAANKMVNNNRLELLNHPLMVQYLQMKWHGYGFKLFLLNLSVYAVFLASLTYFVLAFPNWEHTDNLSGNNSSIFYNSYDTKFDFHCGHVITQLIITVFCFVNMIKEIIQMVQQKAKYFLDVTNLIEWILYITSAMFILPSLTMKVSTHIQWECGAIATFLAWVNLLLFFQRSGRFGIYVVMFIEILKTLLEVLLVFFVLIIAFGLAFYITLSNQTNTANGQSTFGMLMLRGVMMMLGDYDFKETFLYPYTDNNIDTMHYPGLTIFLLVVFILLMPILLMNLLIGLAVGDIGSIQSNAKLKRIAMQVELHTELEKKLPAFFLTRLDQDEVVDKPCIMGKCSSAISKISGGDGGDLEGDLQSKKDSYVYDELFKQKQKMKEFSNTLDKTFDLVRLMVQKMEIKSEAEDVDEGFKPNEGWQAALNKHKLQVAVMSKIKR